MSQAKSWLKHVIGPVLLLSTVCIWAIWIKAFGEGSSPEQRVQLFNSYFPEGTSIAVLTLIPPATSVAAGILGAVFLFKATFGQRVVNVIVILLGILFSILNVFQLL